MAQVPPVGAPVCYRHPSRETYVRCTRCERPICPSCMTEASVGHQCPECVALGRKTQRQVRTAYGATRGGVRGFATIGLIAVNVALLVASALSSPSPAAALGAGGRGTGGLMGTSTPLMQKLAVIGEYRCTFQSNCAIGVSTGEFYRLFTAMFMHYGLVHLALNMYLLWVLGRPLEAMFGPVRFLAIYLICGLGGSVAVYLFAPDAFTAGASGAIFGLFGVFFFALRRFDRSVAPLVPLIVINLVLSFVPGVSLWGHLGGLITGGFLGWSMGRVPQERRALIQTGILCGVLVLLLLLTAWQYSQLTTLQHVQI